MNFCKEISTGKVFKFNSDDFITNTTYVTNKDGSLRVIKNYSEYTNISIPKLDQVYEEMPFRTQFKVVAFDELNGELVNVIINNVFNTQMQRKENIFDFLENYVLMGDQVGAGTQQECLHNYKLVELFTSSIEECIVCGHTKK